MAERATKLSPPPAFQFYFKDWLTGTADLSLEERGAYITLLCHQWARGAIQRRSIPRLLGAMPKHCTRIWKRLQEHFEKGPDGLFRNARLERVRAAQQLYREAQTLKGQRAARARWDARSNAQAMPEQSPSIALQSASASASNTKDFGASRTPETKVVAEHTEGRRLRLAVVPADDPRPPV